MAFTLSEKSIVLILSLAAYGLHGVKSFALPTQTMLLQQQSRLALPLSKTFENGRQRCRSTATPRFPPFHHTTRLGMRIGDGVDSTLSSFETTLGALCLVTLTSVTGYVVQSVLVRNRRQSATMKEPNVVTDKHNFWYPNVEPDPAFAEPLPEGDTGCPFFGNLDAFWGSRDFGSGDFYLRQSRGLATPQLWKYYFVGTPIVVVAGVKAISEMLKSEFEPNGVLTAGASSKKRLKESGDARMLGPESLISEGNKQRHSQLRRLVGQALTPAAISKSLPQLQAAAHSQIQDLLLVQRQQPSVATRLEDYCTRFTLDVAWRQILGLDLEPDEIPTFRQAVLDWITGQTTIPAVTGRGVQYTKGYKARLLLEARVRKRIRHLEANGPDGTSTLSAMLFAEDDENLEDGDVLNSKGNGHKKLTENEIVDNAMLLILAGSETAATTLTNALLCMALNPNVWKKLVEEQRQLELSHGSELTRQVLEESHYLEAVVKETMRIRPVPTGLPRRAVATRTIDGKQIPKGWIYDWSILLTHQLDPITFEEDGSHMDLRKGFSPERWDSPETTPVEYMPLGSGPRFCLGATLALTEMKVFLPTFARQIDDFMLTDASAVDNLRWRPLSIIPKEENGVLVRISPRNQPVNSTTSTAVPSR